MYLYHHPSSPATTSLDHPYRASSGILRVHFDLSYYTEKILHGGASPLVWVIMYLAGVLDFQRRITPSICGGFWGWARDVKHVVI